MADVAGLSSLEMVVLATLAENADGPDAVVSFWSIHTDMKQQGFTKLAATFGGGHIAPQADDQ